GIDDIARSPDLADRALILMLPALSETEREPEEEFWAHFETARSRIFGAVLDAVAMAHRNMDTIQVPNLPRMADFVKWVCAACPALPFTPKEFLDAYRANRNDAVSLILESSPVASAIQQLVKSGSWEGTHTELLEKMNPLVPETTRKHKIWPKNARALSS